jgi:hypothetical protein
MWTSEDNFIVMRDSVSCSGIGYGGLPPQLLSDHTAAPHLTVLDNFYYFFSTGSGPLTIPLFLCVSITFNLLLEAHPRQVQLTT